MDQEQVLGLVGGFYEAAARPDLWNGALISLSDALGGVGINIPVMSLSAARANRFLGIVRLDPACGAKFLNNPRYVAPPTTRWTQAPPPPRPGRMVYREDLWDDSEFRETAIYNDVIRPQGMWHWAFAPLIQKADLLVPIGFLREDRKAMLRDADLRLLDVALLHLARAAHVAMHLDNLDVQARSVSALIDHLVFGVFLLDASGRVLHMNHQADLLVSSADGLTLSRGQLRASLARDQAALQRLLAATADLRHDVFAKPGGALMVRRPSDGRPLVVVAAPVRMIDGLFETPTARIILFVRDPAQHLATPPERLISLYGLTRRQADLACKLAAGHTLDEAAEALGVGRNTVRTHLQHALHKTGAKRQGDLIRIVLGAGVG